MYRLKTPSWIVEKILWLLALGVEISALEEVFGVSEGTIRTWLCRSGKHGRKLHERFMLGLELAQVQLDESNVTRRSRYRRRTPAQAAGLTDHRRSVKEVLSYPLR